MSGWREMFEPPRDGLASVPDDNLNDAERAPDPSEYHPWVLQRGRSHPPLMLELRRFEERSGFWIGWQLSYPTLIAVEYTGNRLLSLDFGVRQFTLEGDSIHELARHLQQGSVLSVTEYTQAIWQRRHDRPIISAIRRIEAQDRSSSR